MTLVIFLVARGGLRIFVVTLVAQIVRVEVTVLAEGWHVAMFIER